jgi:hypothetical protein
MAILTTMNKKNNNNKVKSKPLELFELAGKNATLSSYGAGQPNIQKTKKLLT